MKNKFKKLAKSDAKKWVEVSNLFAKSLINSDEAIREFNSLSANTRTKIRTAFKEYDNLRRQKIPAGEMDSAWEISVMVDAHILATENDTDPLTIIMCLSAPCKNNEQISIK